MSPTPTGLYILPFSQSFNPTHSALRIRHLSRSSKGADIRFGRVALYNPFGVGICVGCRTQDGASLVLGFEILPLRGKDCPGLRNAAPFSAKIVLGFEMLPFGTKIVPGFEMTFGETPAGL